MNESEMLPRIFLQAEWRWLLMLNYEVDPELLSRHVPVGTTLDLYDGRAYVSVVGFMFLQTRVAGIPIPGHRNFEEVNLRFYVKREVEGEVRRGVAFIREIVPRRAIAYVARLLYNEKYSRFKMSNMIEIPGDLGESGFVEYGWTSRKQNRMSGSIIGMPSAMTPGSEEEFIAEHYWGYARQKDGSTVEYRVEHPRWNVWSVKNPLLDIDVKGLYGAEFVEELSSEPASAFVADGSEVIVRRGIRI